MVRKGVDQMAKNEDYQTIWQYGDSEMGIDKNNNLYWNHEKIVTEQKVKLASSVNWAIIVASASTVVMGIMSILSFLKC